MSWVVTSLEAEGRPSWATLIGQADPLAMAAYARGIGQVERIAARLREIAAPALFVWGEQELREGDETLLPPDTRLMVIPGADHVGAFQRSDLIVPALRSLVTLASAPAERPLISTLTEEEAMDLALEAQRATRSAPR